MLVHLKPHIKNKISQQYLHISTWHFPNTCKQGNNCFLKGIPIAHPWIYMHYIIYIYVLMCLPTNHLYPPHKFQCLSQIPIWNSYSLYAYIVLTFSNTYIFWTVPKHWFVLLSYLLYLKLSQRLYIMEWKCFAIIYFRHQFRI